MVFGAGKEVSESRWYQVVLSCLVSCRGFCHRIQQKVMIKAVSLCNLSCRIARIAYILLSCRTDVCPVPGSKVICQA